MSTLVSSYKALVASTGSSLSEKLLKQLHYSPLCKEIVHFSKRPVTSTFSSPKIRYCSGDESEFSKAAVNASLSFLPDAEFLSDLTPGVTAMLSQAKHLSLVLPLGRAKSLEASLAPELRMASRLSLFLPAYMFDAAEFDRKFLDPRRMKTSAYSIYSQFLPNRFREVSIDDLALALRLNAELCAVAEGTSKEELRFEDIMQIIGKDV